MKLYFLDAAGPAILILAPIAIILLVFIWALLEGFIIYLFKIRRFWKSIWHATLVNLGSLLIGIGILAFADNLGISDYVEIDKGPQYLVNWAIYWIVSVIVEALLLKALNRSSSWSNIFFASIIMNILTYIIMFIYVNNFY